MTCQEARQLLHAYLDDELDLSTALQLEAHLTDCPACRNELDAARAGGATEMQPSIGFKGTL